MQWRYETGEALSARLTAAPVKRFAWFPVWTRDGFVVWFQNYWRVHRPSNIDIGWDFADLESAQEMHKYLHARDKVRVLGEMALESLIQSPRPPMRREST